MAVEWWSGGVVKWLNGGVEWWSGGVVEEWCCNGEVVVKW